MVLANMNTRQLISVFFFVSLSYSVYQLASSNETDQKSNAPPSLYSINCTKDKDCLLNSYCYFGRCTCNDGYLPDKDTRRGPVKCIKKALNLEDYCEKDIQCQDTFGPHSVCQKPKPADTIGKCNCTEDAHFVDDYCFRTAFIGQKCDSNDNCLIRNRKILSYCEYSHCICPALHHAIDGGRDCVPTSELGGPCLTSDSCITVNAECKRFCLCKDGYINNSDNSSCLLVATRIGDICDEDRQCSLMLTNAICNSVDATCICKEGHHEVDGECRPTKYLFDKCDHTMECMNGFHPGRGIHCIENICMCKDGYEISERKFCNEIESTKESSDNGGSLPGSSILFLISLCIFTLTTKPF